MLQKVIKVENMNNFLLLTNAKNKTNINKLKIIFMLYLYCYNLLLKVQRYLYKMNIFVQKYNNEQNTYNQKK